MSIDMTCPGCKSLFRLPEELAGKPVRCQQCAQVFTVPLLASTAEAATIPDGPPRAPAAPEAPTIAEPAAAPEVPIMATLLEPPPPKEEVVQARLVEPPPAAPKEEVVQATLVEPPPPKKEAAQATDAEPPADAQKSTGTAAPPRKTSPKPAPAPTMRGSLLAVACFLCVLTIVGGVAASWVAFNLAPLPKTGAPLVDNRDKNRFFEKDKAKVDWEKVKDFPGDNGNVDPRLRLPLDFNGRASGRFNLIGGRKSNTVFLQKNTTYNFLVQSDEFEPQLQIDAPFFVPAITKRDKNSVFLSYSAKQEGIHTVTVTPQQGKIDGAYQFDFAPVMPENPMQINLAQVPTYVSNQALRIHDPAAPSYGPNRLYTLPVQADTEYRFKVTQAAHTPVIVLNAGAFINIPEWIGDPDTRILDFGYKATFTGVLNIHVTSKDYALGNYTLTVNAVEKPGVPREVAFDFNGQYVRNDQLVKDDDIEGKLGRAKTYFITMEAGHGYNIGQSSLALDSLLTLFDPDGKQVAADDNSAGNYNARILFDAKVSGKYRLLATDVKQKTGPFTVEITKFKLPTSIAANQALNIKKREQSGCAIVEAPMPALANTFLAFAWASDGKAFFVADRAGWVHRYRYPDLVSERRTQIGFGAPAQLHACAEGLLVVHPNARELWILDPQSLDLKLRRVRIGGAPVLTTPTLSVAFAPSGVLKPGGGATPGLARQDLKSTNNFLFGNLPNGTLFDAVTPDGRFILGTDSDRKIVRWRVQDRLATPEETSRYTANPWAGSVHPFLISPDGKVLVHRIQAKGAFKEDGPPMTASGFGVAAYRVNDLAKPLFVFDTGAFTSAVAFDKKSGLLCAFDKTKGLMLIDYEGKLVRTLAIDLPDPFSTPLWNMVPHPDGGTLLGFSGNEFAPKLMTIELPKDLPGAKLVENTPEPRKVVFDAKDTYRNNDQLAGNDPRSVRSSPYKTYLVPMEAGWAYDIQQKSAKIDGFLTLFDPAGKQVAEDDDAGGDLNARILFEPKASGEYRLQASNFDSVLGGFTLEITRFKLPVKEAVNKELPVVKKEIDSAKVSEVNVGARTLTSASCVFTTDGKAFLLIDADGWLRRVRVPDFTEEQRLFVGKDVKEIQHSPDGLLAADPKKKEFWLIDPADLRISKRFPSRSIAAFFAVRGQPVAFAPGVSKTKEGKQAAVTFGYDLTGAALPEINDRAGILGIYAMSPDGKFAFGRTFGHKLVRWRVEGRKLVQEELGDLYKDPSGFPTMVVSADGRWLMRSIDKKPNLFDGPDPAPASGFGWIAYKTSDLAKPAFVIDTDSKTAAIASDPKTGHLFTHSATKGLLICDIDGKIVRAIPFAVGNGPNDRIWRIVAHPDGGRLLAFVGPPGAPTVAYIELPRDLPPVKTSPDKNR